MHFSIIRSLSCGYRETYSSEGHGHTDRQRRDDRGQLLARFKRFKIHERDAWPKSTLTWRITQPSRQLSVNTQRGIIRKAADQWASVFRDHTWDHSFNIREITTGLPDINIRWESGIHANENGFRFKDKNGNTIHIYF